MWQSAQHVQCSDKAREKQNNLTIYYWSTQTCYNQLDVFAGNGFGDACEGDFDQDGFADKDDVCPCNPNISRTDFTKSKVVILEPHENDDIQPVFRVNEKVSAGS